MLLRIFVFESLVRWISCARTPSRRSLVSRSRLFITPRDLFSYRNFRNFAWNSPPVSLSILYFRDVSFFVEFSRNNSRLVSLWWISGSYHFIISLSRRKESIASLDRYQRDLSITCHPARKKRLEPQRQVDLPETSLRHGGWQKSRAELGKRRQDYGSSSLDRIASLDIR